MIIHCFIETFQSASPLSDLQIWVASQFGQGSQFFFTLPACVATPPIAPAEHVTDTSTKPLYILLAEDTEENRVLFDAYLRNSPHNLVMVNDGVEALDRVQEETFDVIVMDIQMPRMDGYTATRQIRQWEREMGRVATPIIALSAHTMEEEIQRSREAGCNLYLTKPIRKKKLLDALQQVTS
ncbi:response regulator [Candidatus Magnetaquicoccus inordinatus]|uniref:response regulator n=1 Tax=Candidatus Magnetaquicoccus inordinatus TaxID=2496818 RepID=UPI00102AA6BD|nr:response regulator [Candidatus Magnetaquicoccus inordinatus]